MTRERRAGYLLAAVAAVAVAAAAAGCGSSTGSPGDVLVYSKPTGAPLGRTTEHWIWRAHTDGSHAERLVRGRAPELSPDGRTIAFIRASVRPRVTALYVMPVKGGTPRLLRSAAGTGTWLGSGGWAPDSRQLAVLVGGRSTGSRWALVDSGSGAGVPLHFPGFADPQAYVGGLSFAPDGSAIAYARQDSTGGDVYVYDLRTGRARQLTQDHRSMAPVWGPTAIAFRRSCCGGRGDIWIARRDGHGLRRLTNTKAGIQPVAWSADGTRLLAAIAGAHVDRVWAVDARTGAARELAGLAALDIAKDGSVILTSSCVSGLLFPRGVIKTLPFSGGRGTAIVEGPCAASWNR